SGLFFACRSTTATDRGTAGAPVDASRKDDPGAARAPRDPAPPSASFLRGRVLVPGGKSFDVEVVQDDASRQRGLQHRDRLAPGEGMVFVFPEPARHRFWMSECLIPLDIIWLDANRTVIYVGENLPICAKQPCPDYGPDADSLYVLEVGAGVARRSGIDLGIRLTLLFDKPPNPT